MKRIALLVIGSLAFSGAGRAVFAEEKEKDWLQELLNVPYETAEQLDQTLTTSIFSLGDIHVTGARVSSSRSDETATQTPHNVTLVGRREIEQSSGTDVASVLARQEGVTYNDDLGQGSDARVDLRGFGGEAKQALVLFDGLRAVEPFDNSMTWHLYAPEYLERIEIQRGGASTAYGEGALSGVIQMKTKEPTKDLHAAAEQVFGAFSTERSFAETSGTVSGVGFYMAGRYEDTAGYRQNADHDSVSALAKVSGRPTDLLTLENSFYYADNTTGIPGPLTRAERDADRRQKDPDGQFGDAFADRLVQDGVTAIYLAEPIGLEITDQFGYRSRQQDSDQTFGGSFPGRSLNRIGTETFSNVVQGSRSWSGKNYGSTFTGGLEWSIDDIHNPFTFQDFTFGPFSSDRSIDRRMVGYFLQNKTTLWEKLIVEVGARHDRIDWDLYDLVTPALQKRKQAVHWSPKAGVEYRVFDALSVYGSASESFKAPDANTLIFETPNLFTPTPDIDPSVARHSEAGVRYAHPVFGSVRADYFYIETKKEILFNDITNRNENFDTVRQGVELADEIALTSSLQIFMNYTYTSAKFDNGLFDGRSIPLVPRSRWSAGAVWEPAKGWTVSASATGVRDQFALNDLNNIFPMDDYWTLGGKITYRREGWQIFVKAENLLDERYDSFVTSDGVSTVNFNPAPSVYVESGVRIEL